MTRAVLTVGPEHTIRQVAQLMTSRRVGSAVVHDPDSAGTGILTERDVLNVIGRGLDPDIERATNHLTWDVVYAGPEWTLDDAAAAMMRGGFRHLVVMDADEVQGVISVRDIIRAWSEQRQAAAALS
jgi:CBS domain-containing protein